MGPIEWIMDAFQERPQVEPRAHISSGDAVRRHEDGMDDDLWRAFIAYAECRKGLHGEVPPDTDNIGRVLCNPDAAMIDVGRSLMLLGAHDAGAMKGGIQTNSIAIMSNRLLERMSAAAPLITVADHSPLHDVRLVVIDVDGVLTDGSVTYGTEGAMRQTFHIRDELGMQMLRDAGIRVALLSERTGDVLQSYTRQNAGMEIHTGVADKRMQVVEMQERLKIPVAYTVVIGDDAPDVPMLEVAAHAFAPADAMPVYRDKVEHVLTKDAGHGAVREMVDMIMAGRVLQPDGSK